MAIYHITVSFLIGRTFLILGVQSIAGRRWLSLSERRRVLSPHGWSPTLPITQPCPQKLWLQHWRNAQQTNTLYWKTTGQTVGPICWLFWIYTFSHLHWWITWKRITKATPPPPSHPQCPFRENTKQDMTSMNTASKEHVNQSIGGKKQYKYTFMRILNDKMYRIFFFTPNNQNE